MATSNNCLDATILFWRISRKDRIDLKEKFGLSECRHDVLHLH